MTICAKYCGGQVRDCKRGAKSCPCLTEQMAEILTKIGYPRRGTEDERMDIQDAANFIQSNFSLSQLEQAQEEMPWPKITS